MSEQKATSAYPLIDGDPHASRVIRYMRPSDLGVWAAATASFPALLTAWDMAEGTRLANRTVLRLGGFMGFMGGFLLAYQRSSARFWGWSENEREQRKDYEELSARASAGLPLYGECDQPIWVQSAAYRNSTHSQLKFAAFPMFNLVNHPFHGTDPAKYGVQKEGGETAES